MKFKKIITGGLVLTGEILFCCQGFSMFRRISLFAFSMSAYLKSFQSFVSNRLKFVTCSLFVTCILSFGVFPATTLAYTIQDLINAPVEEDFTLGPGKAEFILEPGEKTTKMIYVTSRLGRPMTFKVEVEDFKGSETGESASILLGDKQGPYSLKDYLRPEVYEFTLDHGQKINLPINITIPQDASPGGLYGAVIITTVPEKSNAGEIEGAQGQIQFISRVASLFFVRVNGNVLEEGGLEDFSTLNSKSIYSSGSIPFTILYRNTGSVHLVTYGIIEIKNMWGKKIEEIEIDPYFIMPGSLRTRELKWERPTSLGMYTAHLSLNRGYKDIIDEAKISFWILPWKVISISSLILISLILAIIWLAKNIEFKKKGKKTTK